MNNFYKICILAFFLSISLTISSQEMGNLKGKVVNATAKALENVNITLTDSDIGTTTDSEGRFTIEQLSPGEYTVVASSIGYDISKRKLRVKEGSTSNLDFILNTTITMLSEISVKGGALGEEKGATTVNVVDLEKIKSLSMEQPLRMIEQVPGVDIQAYRQGGVADQFSIRGFGGGGHGGQAGVQVNGISLNEAEGHSDGYADLNVLIPLNLQRLKVYKGPSSVLFGRFGQGGTLALETRKGGEYQDISISGGSFNTLDAQYAMGEAIDIGNSGKKLNTNLAFQFMSTDGYSENSETLKGNASARLSYQLGENTDMALSLRGHQSEWNGPGYISEEQFLDPNRRNLQDANGENDGGSKRFYSQRLDVNHNFNDNLRLLLFGYSVQQDFTRFAKFGFEPGGQTERFNTRNVYAGGGSLNASSTIAGFDADWILGLEYYNETTDRARWATSDRVRQMQTLDRTFSIQSLSAFAQGEFEISKYFRPSIGLRYDTYFGEFVNRDPGQDGFSRDLNNLSHVSPKLGVRSTIAPGLDLRVSASNGFALPTSTTKYDPDANLDPAILWQYEAGASYIPVPWMELDVTGYVLNTSNEVVSDPPGSGNLINAGKTQRRGIESQVSLRPVDGLSIQGSFTYTETEIMNNPDENQVGKALTSIPFTIFFGNVQYVLENGLGARISLRDIGPFFIAADNSAEYGGYTLSNFTAFYNFGGRNSNSGRVFFEVRNLLDEAYAESVFALGGTNAYAPAPLRNFSLGVQYNFK